MVKAVFSKPPHCVTYFLSSYKQVIRKQNCNLLHMSDSYIFNKNSLE